MIQFGLDWHGGWVRSKGSRYTLVQDHLDLLMELEVCMKKASNPRQFCFWLE